MTARRGPDPLKEAIRDLRRDHVVAVARRLFGDRGTTDVPMDEIAAEAGVARSTVYVYFANRDELLRACLKDLHAQLLEGLASSWEDGAPAGVRLERLVEELLARIDESPAFFRLAMVTQDSPAHGSVAVGTELAVIGLDVARLLRDLYLDGLAAGTFRPMDPDRATTLVGQQLYGAMAVRAGEVLPEPRAVVAAETCDFILRALAAT